MSNGATAAAIEHVPCEQCGAAVGQPCAGLPLARVHRERRLRFKPTWKLTHCTHPKSKRAALETDSLNVVGWACLDCGHKELQTQRFIVGQKVIWTPRNNQPRRAAVVTAVHSSGRVWIQPEGHCHCQTLEAYLQPIR